MKGGNFFMRIVRIIVVGAILICIALYFEKYEPTTVDELINSINNSINSEEVAEFINSLYMQDDSDQQDVDYVNLYAEPSDESRVIKQIPLGTDLSSIEEYNTEDYVYVFFDGEYGYVQKKYIITSSSSSKAIYSTDLYICALKVLENSSLYNYSIGVTTYCEYVDSATGFQKTSEDNHINISYGIVIDRSWNYLYFEKVMGWSASETKAILSKYSSGGQIFTDCTFEELEEIQNLLITSTRETVARKTKSLNLSENEIDALTIAYYLYGNLGNFISAYQEYGNTEELRNSFYVSNSLGNKLYPFSVNLPHGGSASRAQDTWEIFHDANYAVSGYIVQDGILVPS